MPIVDRLSDDRPEIALLARVAAIPNLLEPGLLGALLNLGRPALAELDTLQRAGMVETRSDNRRIVIAAYRQELLDSWWQQLDDFREYCRRGYQFLAPPPGQPRAESSVPILQELTYLGLGAGLPIGQELLEHVYGAARNHYQLGLCEQLLLRVEAISPALLPPALTTLRFLRADLLLARYQFDRAAEQYTELLSTSLDPLQTGMAQLGLGRVRLAQHRWQSALQNLNTAEKALGESRQDLAQGIALLSIGMTYDDIAEISGGLFRGDEDTVDPIITVRRSMDDVPITAGRWLPLRIAPLAEYYLRVGVNAESRVGRLLTAVYVGSNYQDWLIARLQVQAIDRLQSAAAIFERIGAAEEWSTAQELIARLYHQLGHPRAAQRLLQELLTQPLTQSSVYSQARILLVRGQLRADQKRWAEALQDLVFARDVLARYADWARAGTAAQFCGHIHMRRGDPAQAARDLRAAVEFFETGSDPLLRTQALLALSQVSDQSELANLPLSFLVRFPGELYQRIQHITLRVTSILTWVGMLALALLLGVVLVLVQTLIAFAVSGIPLPVGLEPIFVTLAILVMPVVLVWLSRLLFTIGGGGIWAYALPLDDLIASPPETLVLEPTQISRLREDRTTDRVRWEEILGTVSAERHIWGKLLRVGSQLRLVTADRVFDLQAATRFYRALKAVVSKRLEARPHFSANLDYIRSKWFVGIILTAALLAFAFVLIFNPSADQGDNTQSVSTAVGWGFGCTLFFIVFFAPFGMFLASRLQNRRLQQSINDLRHKT